MAKMKHKTKQEYTSHKIKNEKQKPLKQLCVNLRDKTSCSCSLEKIGQYCEYICLRLNNRYISVFVGYKKNHALLVSIQNYLAYLGYTILYFARITWYMVMCVPLKRRTRKKNSARTVRHMIKMYHLQPMSPLVFLAKRTELPLSMDKLMVCFDICVSYNM